jgi:hypothetical protein
MIMATLSVFAGEAITAIGPEPVSGYDHDLLRVPRC